jgi:hypothetical protein
VSNLRCEAFPFAHRVGKRNLLTLSPNKIASASLKAFKTKRENEASTIELDVAVNGLVGLERVGESASLALIAIGNRSSPNVKSANFFPARSTANSNNKHFDDRRRPERVV